MQKENINNVMLSPADRSCSASQSLCCVSSSRNVSVRDIGRFVIPRTTTLRGDGKGEKQRGPEQQHLRTTTCFNHAFTLIELLVVVLIIGILAAIAVPQYEMAVAKSQYATVKQLAVSIKNAQEVYYMANGQYAAKLDDLDVNFPASDDERNTDTSKYYKNGRCFITSSQSICNVTTAIGTLGYQVWYDHSGKANMRSCIAFNTDLTSSANKFCKAETGSNNFHKHEDQNFTSWWEK